MPEVDINLDAAMPMIRTCLQRGQSVVFSPKGTSMLPMLQQGRDQVTLGPVTGALKKYDLPLYQRRNGCYVLHRVVKAGETYTCIGDNQFVYEPGLCQDQMIAVVTAFTHKGKSYSVNAWQYRLYCRFWYYSRPVRHFLLRVKSIISRYILHRNGR